MGEGLQCTSLHITFFLFFIFYLTSYSFGYWFFFNLHKFPCFNKILKQGEASITYPNGFYMQWTYPQAIEFFSYIIL